MCHASQSIYVARTILALMSPLASCHQHAGTLVPLLRFMHWDAACAPYPFCTGMHHALGCTGMHHAHHALGCTMRPLPILHTPHRALMHGALVHFLIWSQLGLEWACLLTSTCAPSAWLSLFGLSFILLSLVGLTAAWDYSVRCWNRSDWQCISVVSMDDWVTCLTVSADLFMHWQIGLICYSRLYVVGAHYVHGIRPGRKCAHQA